MGSAGCFKGSVQAIFGRKRLGIVMNTIPYGIHAFLNKGLVFSKLVRSAGSCWGSSRSPFPYRVHTPPLKAPHAVRKRYHVGAKIKNFVADGNRKTDQRNLQQLSWKPQKTEQSVAASNLDPDFSI